MANFTLVDLLLSGTKNGSFAQLSAFLAAYNTIMTTYGLVPAENGFQPAGGQSVNSDGSVPMTSVSFAFYKRNLVGSQLEEATAQWDTIIQTYGIDSTEVLIIPKG